jgi:hypothetical protein
MAQQVEKPWFLDIGCCTGIEKKKIPKEEKIYKFIKKKI